MSRPDWHPVPLEYEVIDARGKRAGEHEVAINSVQRDDHAIRVRYRIEPPLAGHRFGLSGEAKDDLGTEYDDVGGAFGLRDDPPRTDGVLSFRLPRADATLLRVRLVWESFDDAWEG